MSRNQIVTITTTTKPNDLVPSSKLLKAIDNCVTSFNKTQDAVNIALEIGQKEGFNPRYIGNMIRERLLAAGFHRNTVARVLSPEAKSNPRGHGGDSRKMLQNQNQKLIWVISVSHGNQILTDPKEYGKLPI